MAAGLLAATAAAFVAPAPIVAAALVVAMAALPSRGRTAFAGLAVLAIALNAAFFALALPGPGWDLGPLAVSRDGARRGLAGGVRLAAVTALNLAVLARARVEAVLDGLRLGRPATAFLAAVLASAHDLGREWGHLVDARRLDGTWPAGRWARVRASAARLPALVVHAVHRAAVRRDALRLAGHDTAPRFAAVAAVTSLAMAARMAFVAVPNDPATFTAVFLGGLLFGPATGALAGLAAMAATNLLISGIHPVAFANAPAMALLGVLGGLVGRLRLGREDRWTLRWTAAACGVAGVVLFSVAADALTWLLVPEFRGDVAALRALVLAGLAFNAVPAAACAVTFALATGPVARAAEAAGVPHLSGMGHARPGGARS